MVTFDPQRIRCRVDECGVAAVSDGDGDVSRRGAGDISPCEPRFNARGLRRQRLSELSALSTVDVGQRRALPNARDVRL